jgi:hypothetical protein
MQMKLVQASPILRLVILLSLFSCFFPAVLLAQTYCEEGYGPVNTGQPQGITSADIIQKSASKEAIFKRARDNYTYTQEVTVQTLDGHTVDGEYKEVWDITYDHKGNRIENVTFAPEPSLRRVQMTHEDFDDIRNKMPFVMTSEDLPQYDALYIGTQRVDEIYTYVYDIAPKRMEKNKRYFQGRIWVDNRDFQIVKTCGKDLPEKRDKNGENLSPKFVTYREQVDGKYWFPTYTRADDVLHFSTGDVHIRTIIKYTSYKRFGSRTKLTFKGEAPEENKRKPPPK